MKKDIKKMLLDDILRENKFNIYLYSISKIEVDLYDIENVQTYLRKDFCDMLSDTENLPLYSIGWTANYVDSSTDAILGNYKDLIRTVYNKKREYPNDAHDLRYQMTMFAHSPNLLNLYKRIKLIDDTYHYYIIYPRQFDEMLKYSSEELLKTHDWIPNFSKDKFKNVSSKDILLFRY